MPKQSAKLWEALQGPQRIENDRQFSGLENKIQNNSKFWKAFKWPQWTDNRYDTIKEKVIHSFLRGNVLNTYLLQHTGRKQGC